MKQSIPSMIALTLVVLVLFIIYFIKLIILISILGLIVFVAHKIYKHKVQVRHVKNLKHKNLDIEAEIMSLQKLEPLDSIGGFVSGADEVVLVLQPGTCYVATKDSKRKGHFESISVPLPMHLHANLGQFEINNPVKYNWAPDGYGNIYLTNKRFIFISEFGNYIIPLKKIINVKNLEYGLRVDIEGKKPIIFDSGDARLFYTYQKLTYKSELEKMLEMYGG